MLLIIALAFGFLASIIPSLFGSNPGLLLIQVIAVTCGFIMAFYDNSLTGIGLSATLAMLAFGIIVNTATLEIGKLFLVYFLPGYLGGLTIKFSVDRLRRPARE